MFLDILRTGFEGLASQTNINTVFSVVLAAIVHSGIVRKEIKVQVANITDSINKVTEALKLELSSQSSRLGNIESDVLKISSRVEAIEQKEKNHGV